MRSWKKYEKNLTEYLQKYTDFPTKRRSRAEMGEEVMDIESGPLSVEAKCAEGRPQYLENWLEQAEDNSEGLIPIVVWHQGWESLDNDTVIIQLNFLISLIQMLRGGTNSLQKRDLGAVKKILRGIEEIEEGVEML